jgi:hypothetical protein
VRRRFVEPRADRRERRGDAHRPRIERHLLGHRAGIAQRGHEWAGGGERLALLLERQGKQHGGLGASEGRHDRALHRVEIVERREREVHPVEVDGAGADRGADAQGGGGPIDRAAAAIGQGAAPLGIGAQELGKLAPASATGATAPAFERLLGPVAEIAGEGELVGERDELSGEPATPRRGEQRLKPALAARLADHRLCDEPALILREQVRAARKAQQPAFELGRSEQVGVRRRGARGAARRIEAEELAADRHEVGAARHDEPCGAALAGGRLVGVEEPSRLAGTGGAEEQMERHEPASLPHVQDSVRPSTGVASIEEPHYGRLVSPL